LIQGRTLQKAIRKFPSNIVFDVNILLGYDIKVFTDHKNLLYSKQSSDRLMRWKLLLKEYKIKWQHIKGEHNIVADALSRLPIDDSMEDTVSEETNSPPDIP
jgi:hypothetical protein